MRPCWGAAFAVAALVAGAAPVAAAAPTDAPTTTPPTTTLTGPVLAPLTAAAADAGPTSAGLAAALDSLARSPSLGGSVGVAVADVATGRLLYGRGETRPLVPASVAKIFTAVAALQRLGPDARLETRVIRAAASAGAAPTGTDATTAAPAPVEITLVGGGDPTLTALPAGAASVRGYPDEARLDELAQRTARTLREQGVAGVTLRYDGELFAGPARAATWRTGYLPAGVVAPVIALMVDHARVRAGADTRTSNPASAAAQRFADRLAARGIPVTGQPRPGRAPGGGATLAAVASPPVSALVERMLVESDNDLGEALARHVARAAGEPVTFDGAADAVLSAVSDVGVDVVGVRLYDGSGLSRSTAVPAATVARTLALAASPDHPRLHAAVAGLAIGGFTGTLHDRFEKGSPARVAGLVRAKTGTLTGISSLAGVIPDATGRLLAFAFLADSVPGNTLEARAVLDEMTARLAQCGCR